MSLFYCSQNAVVLTPRIRIVFSPSHKAEEPLVPFAKLLLQDTEYKVCLFLRQNLHLMFN